MLEAEVAPPCVAVQVDDRPFIDGLELQSEDVKMEFDSRSKSILLSLAEQVTLTLTLTLTLT